MVPDSSSNWVRQAIVEEMADSIESGTLKGAAAAQPEKWDGHQATWTEWSFDMMNWARRHDLAGPRYMNLAREHVEEIDHSSLSDDNRMFSARLMTDLALKTTGAAKRIVMNLENLDEGLEAWRL